MASLYKRSRSPFWWISFIDYSGKRACKSTRLRWDVTAQSREARELCGAVSVREPGRGRPAEAWDSWVPGFLEGRYSHTPATLARYDRSWRNIGAYLRATGVTVPRQLTRGHVKQFIDWRREKHIEEGVYKCGKNNALQDCKVLGIVLNEAVACGMCSTNVAAKLGIRPDPKPEKPRISASEDKAIRDALASEPVWMRTSYEIAIAQGCRLTETCLPLSDIDLNRKVIAFRTKGHKDSLAEFPLNPVLVPLIKRLKKAKRTMTCDMPPNPSAMWSTFFRRIGLGHLCFHSTRVTFVTSCYEAGLRPDEAMRLVGHSSYQIHKLYGRVTADKRYDQELMARLARRQ